MFFGKTRQEKQPERDNRDLRRMVRDLKERVAELEKALQPEPPRTTYAGKGY